MDESSCLLDPTIHIVKHNAMSEMYPYISVYVGIKHIQVHASKIAPKLPQNLAPSSVPERRGFGGPKPKINMSEAFGNPAITMAKLQLTKKTMQIGSDCTHIFDEQRNESR